GRGPRRPGPPPRAAPGRGDVSRPPAGGRGRRRALDGDRWAHHGRSVGSGCGRERVARRRALARGRRGPRRGRLRPLRIRPLGRRPGGDMEGPRDAEVAELAQEVTPPPEGKRAERVRQLRDTSYPLSRASLRGCRYTWRVLVQGRRLGPAPTHRS